jgi:MFS transporter, DHA2 family, methylenomycin A resistance protein
MQDTSATHSRQSDWLLLTGATLGFLVVMLDVTIVNVALHQIGTSLGSGVAGLQWIVNAYTLVFAALILTAGALGDRLGARRLFIAGFALFGIGSLGCGSSPTIAFLIAARAFQGIGAAVLVPCSLALINHAFTSEADRNRAVSIWAAGASVAIAAGPVVGGVLIATVGWRSIFFVNVPIATIGIWLVWHYSRETPRTRNRGIDLPGQILAIVALACLAATMIQGGGLGWTHPLVLCGFVAFIVATAGFLFAESRSQSPMLPLEVFRNPTFSAATMIGWIINVAFYGLIFVLSLFFQETQNYSPLRTGLAFLPMTAIILPANLASGWVATHSGARVPMVTGQLVMMTGCLSLLGVHQGAPYWHLAIQMLLIGGGIGFTVPAMTSALLGAVDPSMSGVASGVLNASRQAGSVVGVAMFGSFIGHQGHIVAGLRLALIVCAVILLPSALLALRMPHRPPAK